MRKIYSRDTFFKIKNSLNAEFNITINSDSMEPWIYKDELIKAVPVEASQLKKHDIIIFWSEMMSILVCHIFIEQKNGQLITKSLKRNTIDEPNSAEYLLGVVTSHKFTLLQRLLYRFYRAPGR